MKRFEIRRALGGGAKKPAFTLAEVLITLGIIGVVAAMTLPTLIQQHQKQVLANKKKKGLNTVSNLVNKIQANEDASNYETTSLFTDSVCAPVNCGDYIGYCNDACEEAYGNPSSIERIISKNLKTVKICQGDECDIEYIFTGGIDNNGKLSHNSSNRKKLNKSSSDVWSTVTVFYTTDGMIIYVFPNRQGISFWYDTNGEKGPNEYGRDLFALKYCINNKGVMYSSYGDACVSIYSDYIRPTGEPLVHLMSNGWKMDY